MDYVIAFVVGGLICAAAQLVLDTTKLPAGKYYGRTCLYRGASWFYRGIRAV